MKQQRENYNGQCNVTLFSLLTCYSLTSKTSSTKPISSQPPLIIVNEHGIILDSEDVHKFQLGNTVYTRYKKECVVNLRPFVAYNTEDERSCYSRLLVHIPWPSNSRGGTQFEKD